MAGGDLGVMVGLGEWVAVGGGETGVGVHDREQPRARPNTAVVPSATPISTSLALMYRRFILDFPQRQAQLAGVAVCVVFAVSGALGGVVGIVAALAEGGEVFVGVVGRIVVEVGGRQNDFAAGVGVRLAVRGGPGPARSECGG